MTGQTALVTGGALGIGRGIATVLARAGARVIVADRDLARAQVTAQGINAGGGQSLALPLDVADEASANRCIVEAIGHFGGIDALVNNAGLFQSALGLEQDADDFNHGLDVNVTGIWRMVRAIAPHFESRGGGRIINISSVGGRKGVGFAPGYCASKAAVINLSQSLAALLGPRGINVNTVCPGAVSTAMQDSIHRLRGTQGTHPGEDSLPLAGPLTAEDIGYAVVFFASAQSRHVTGQALNVDCGYSMN